MKQRHITPLFILLSLFVLLFQTVPSYGIELWPDEQPPLPLNPNDHGDAYWAALAQDAEPFDVNQAELRVAAMDELDDIGSWDSVLAWPHIPVSASVLPDGRIMTWSSNDTDGFPGGQPEQTYTGTWNPETGQFDDMFYTGHDMFCAHQVLLEDGTLFVMGGRNTVELTSQFDYQTDTWTPADDMNSARWYPTSVALPNGEVFIASGSGGATTAETWSQGNGWDLLSNINWGEITQENGWNTNWWPYLHVAPNGQLFHSGPTETMHWVDTTGEGSLIDAGLRPNNGTWYPKYGNAVMYEEGQILVVGGQPDIDTTDTGAEVRAISIDINGASPIVTELNPMQYARAYSNAVILPNGEVMVIGGNTSGQKFVDDGAQLTPEIWNPDTGQWTAMADMSIPRNYHSVALLLPDGRVWSGGGGLCNGCAGDHQDAQVFNPPYLFDANGNLAARPSVTSAPNVIKNGQTFVVNTSESISEFGLVKMSSVTHGVNTDQRFLTPANTDLGGNQYELTAHTNLNVLTPGYWMLFAINANGVPSEAHMLQVSTEGIPKITNPGQQLNSEEDTVSLTITATDSDSASLTYTAVGLPSGLTIDSNTGEISGTIALGSSGTYNVTITVSDGESSSEMIFEWVVTPQGRGQILREYWLDIGGSDIASLTSDADYPAAPDGQDFLTSFEAPSDWADNYGTRIRGYIHPDVTGDYTFWIAGDDNSELWLSSDDSVASISLIANVPGWSSPRQWDKFTEQQSGTITLQAGEQYYVEVLHKEGGGLDNIAVAWQPPGGLQEVISGQYLSHYSDAPTVENPGNQSDNEGNIVSLTIAATDPNLEPLTYSANGLPVGLSINSSNGEISGTLDAGSVGLSQVTVTVSDGVNDVNVQFDWTVLAAGVIMSEAGSVTVSQADSNSWHSVSFVNSYVDPVVVMAPASFNDAEPLSVRVRNVSSTGFEFQIDEWDYLDGNHGSETISYFVVEDGVYTLPSGQQLIANQISNLATTFSIQNFESDFTSTPVMLAQVASTNGPEAVVLRMENVTTSQFEIKLEEEEDGDDTHSDELVHWIGIEPGVESGQYETAVTGTTLDEVVDTITFAQTYSDVPLFLAHLQTHEGGDTATVRYQSLTANSAEVFLEEEQSANTEVGHVDEVLGYLVIDPAFADDPFGTLLPPNQIPIITDPGHQNTVEGETISLQIVATDNDGDSLTFSASGLPGTATMNAATGLIEGYVEAGDAGNYSVTVVVNDGIDSSTMTFDWTVHAAPGGWVDFADETANRLTYTPNSFEKDTAVGDLNNDGWNDVVIVHKTSFDIAGQQADTLLVNVDGVLVDQTATYAPAMLTHLTDARDVLLNDIDSDGWLDIIIATTFEDQPALYRNLGNDGSGNWLGFADESGRLPGSFDTSTVQFCAITAGDVNGDGYEDLYFANYALDGGAKDVLLINDGAGNFTEESQARLGDYRWSAFGTSAQIVDMDDDGDNDIVKLSAEYNVAPWGHAGIFTLFNDGIGNFISFDEIPTNASYMFWIDDLNNDGLNDLFVQDDDQDYVQMGTGFTVDTAVTFAQSDLTAVQTSDHGGNFRFADLDGDGDLDMGIADVDTMWPPCDTGPDSFRKFTLLLNDGTGQMFDPYGGAKHAWSQNTFDFDFIDIDRDGNLDIFAAQCDGYAVYMNTAVSSINQPPILTNTVDQNNSEGDAVSLTISATDADGDSLTYSAAGLPTDLTIDSVTGEIAGTLGFASEGSYNVTVTVSDGVITDNDIFIWTISGSNQAPTINNPGDQTNAEGDVMSLAISASDEDGDSLSYSATGLPADLTIDSGTGEIVGTLGFGSAGSYTVTVSVSDGIDTADTTFDWTITAVTPPTEDNEIVYYSITGSGFVGGDVLFSDEDIVAYDKINDTWELYFDGSDVGLNISGNADVDAFHVREDGSILLSIRATETLPDVGEITNADLILFTPTSLGDDTAGTFSMYLDGSDVGLTGGGEDITAVYEMANGDLVISTVGSNNVGTLGTLRDEDLLLFSGTYGDSTSGTWSLYFDGSDADMDDSTEEFYGVSIDESSNEIFLANRGPFDLGGVVGSAWDIAVCQSAVTGENSSCIYALYLAGDTIGMENEYIDGITIQRTSSVPGNQAPFVTNPGDQTSTEGDVISLTIIATDGDGDTLTYSQTGLPAGLSIDGATGEISGTATTVGSYSVSVSVDDGTESRAVSFNWEIVEPNVAPSVTNPGAQTNDEGESVSLIISATDGNEDTLTYSATGLPTGLAISAATGEISGVLNYESAGSFIVSVDVTDGIESASVSFDWTVNDVEPPAGSDIIYISSTSSGNVGGVSFVDEDIVAYDPTTDSWSMYFDGSDVGFGGNGALDTSAIHVRADGSILLTIRQDTEIADLGLVENSDILLFTPTSTGETTAGTFSIYFDGSDVDMSSGGEAITAVYELANGDLVISTIGSNNVGSLGTNRDEDLLLFSGTFGENTSGSWSLYFDGSDVELSDSTEEIYGVAINETTGDIIFTTRGDFTVTGASGSSSDLVGCYLATTGDPSSCAYAIYATGVELGVGSENIDGLSIGQ